MSNLLFASSIFGAFFNVNACPCQPVYGNTFRSISLRTQRPLKQPHTYHQFSQHNANAKSISKSHPTVPIIISAFFAPESPRTPATSAVNTATSPSLGRCLSTKCSATIAVTVRITAARTAIPTTILSIFEPGEKIIARFFLL